MPLPLPRNDDWSRSGLPLWSWLPLPRVPPLRSGLPPPLLPDPVSRLVLRLPRGLPLPRDACCPGVTTLPPGPNPDERPLGELNSPRGPPLRSGLPLPLPRDPCCPPLPPVPVFLIINDLLNRILALLLTKHAP